MPTYLVERYLPGASVDEVRAAVDRARAIAESLESRGEPIGLRWSALVADEDTCVCVFDAPDRESVADLNRAAGFDFDRIVEAIPLLPGDPWIPAESQSNREPKR